ncbi:MAG: dihydrodipicolinate synthase family protein, partial [Fusobacteriaceae bacterium]|nr:dihydrodipicolinate synthase family protein [Fusobacteriaceae bacterium]
MSIFVGSGVALVTPFNEDKTVNYEKLKELIEFQIKNSTDAIVVTGTTGEGSTLSDLEQKEIISQTVKIVNKRVPVIAGTGSNDTKHAIELSQQAENLGADGLLVITPYYNRTNKRGLIEHFKAIANSV